MNASQEQLPPEMLLTQAPFNSIFPIQTPVLQRIVDRMKKIGFDPAHPILVWKRGSDAVVIDGHTRLQAALSLGIRDIPVIFREFDNPGDALDYAVSQQVERRNMTPADMLRYIEAADKLLERGRKKLAPNGANSEDHPVQHGKSAAKLAEVLNVSLRKARGFARLQEKVPMKPKSSLQRRYFCQQGLQRYGDPLCFKKKHCAGGKRDFSGGAASTRYEIPYEEHSGKHHCRIEKRD